MNWDMAQAIWGRPIINQKPKIEAAKLVAKRLKKGDTVGVGSGSTSFLTLKELVDRRSKEGLEFSAIPTSLVIELICQVLDVPTATLNRQKPDWSFDGADEVDELGNMIKGRGGAMLREKQLIKACPEVYIAVDKSKLVNRLGEKFPVPVEVKPKALFKVEKILKKLNGVTEIKLRQAVSQDGPIITENGNIILDVWFKSISVDVEQRLKAISGVAESGLFIGYKPHIIVSKN